MIVAGFGHRTGATPGSLHAALARATQGLAADGLSIAALAAPDDKLALVSPVALALGLPLVPVAAAALAAVDTPTRSPASLAARGTGSVAEAAALAAAGPGGHLLVTRRIAPDRMATCAIAIGPTP